MPIREAIAKENGIDPKRKVLYRNFHEIGGIVYLTEFSRNDKKVFIILFPNFEKPDFFISQILSDKIFSKLLYELNGVYELFVSKSLKLKYGKLWIEGYHG